MIPAVLHIEKPQEIRLIQKRKQIFAQPNTFSKQKEKNIISI